MEEGSIDSLDWKFQDVALTTSDGVSWVIRAGVQDLEGAPDMTSVLQELFYPLKWKRRIYVYVPLAIKSPPMAPEDPETELRFPALSKWRYCVQCHKRIQGHGSVCLLFVKGLTKNGPCVAWEPMLACRSCSPQAEDAVYFPWIVSLRSLWDTALFKAFNLCSVCLKATVDGSICSEECANTHAAIQKFHADAEDYSTADDLIDMLVERMRAASVSLYALAFAGRCTVKEECFAKVRGHCDRCGKLTFCFNHLEEGEQHVKDQSCASFLDLWDNKNFVALG